MLNHTILSYFKKNNTFINCKFLFVGCHQPFKRNYTLNKHKCGAKDQQKMDNYCRKCFQWTKHGHNLRNHTRGFMCEDRRFLISAQVDPAYSNIERYITSTHSFVQFPNKISFIDRLGESIKKNSQKIRAERRSGSILQQRSAEWGPKVCSNRFDQMAIRTELSETEPTDDNQLFVTGPSMLPFLLLPDHPTWHLCLLQGHPKRPLRLLLGKWNSRLLICLGQPHKPWFVWTRRRQINYSM